MLKKSSHANKDWVYPCDIYKCTERKRPRDDNTLIQNNNNNNNVDNNKNKNATAGRRQDATGRQECMNPLSAFRLLF